jgi:hypothetical protein
VFGDSQEVDIKKYIADHRKWDVDVATQAKQTPPRDTIKYRERIVGKLWEANKSIPDVYERVEFYRNHGHKMGEAPPSLAKDGTPQTPEQYQEYLGFLRMTWRRAD